MGEMEWPSRRRMVAKAAAPAPREGAEIKPRDVKVDGRVARSQRTRAAVLDALIALIEEHQLRPSARMIAERSQVSTRSIFQHFPDLETLFAAAVQRESNRFGQFIRPIAADGPYDQRAGELIAQRFGLFEDSGAIYRAGILDRPFSPSLQFTFKVIEDAFRKQIEVAFKVELARWRSERREVVVRQVAAVTGFHTWWALRWIEKLDLDDARATMAAALDALIKSTKVTKRV